MTSHTEIDSRLEADRELIIAATTYRSGNDSIGSVYMGGMAMSMLGAIIGHGGWHDDRRLADVIRAAPRAKIDKALEHCKSIIDYMQAHPVEKCPCCGAIRPAKAAAPAMSPAELDAARRAHEQDWDAA